MIQGRSDPLRWERGASRTTSRRNWSSEVVSRVRAIAAAGSASLIAIALFFAPASAQTAQKGRAAAVSSGRAVDAFTPAVSDPRLAAALARRGARLNSGFRFTPATTSPERSQAIRVAVRGRAEAPD